MIPDLIRPIQLAPGPADKVLVHAVQGLLGEVERMFSKEQKGNDEPGLDLNELGERVVLDEITGEVISGETYYGWSRQFCPAATREVDPEAHHAMGKNAKGSRGILENEASRAAEVPVVTAKADHTVAIGVEVGVEPTATVEAVVPVMTSDTTVPGASDHTVDRDPAHTRLLTIAITSLMTVQIALQFLQLNNPSRPLSPISLHRQQIFPSLHLRQVVIKAPGLLRHPLLIWLALLKAGFPILP
ncbi:hypothetical protein NM208_g14252 [Fusarium decemcellulare]|uniref:Uncharacterized protein n=1 Tax=Fusarium decemcellulare TaxID=57161 RepID=A0ACC1RIK4_9HYPO|nr:hypothetical protein NM208_g14252 [Fusarium decemcellulare]